ncbi:MAG: hypothetical protein R3E60_06305 [Alphaproteobacteria bacterium]
MGSIDEHTFGHVALAPCKIAQPPLYDRRLGPNTEADREGFAKNKIAKPPRHASNPVIYWDMGAQLIQASNSMVKRGGLQGKAPPELLETARDICARPANHHSQGISVINAVPEGCFAIHTIEEKFVTIFFLNRSWVNLEARIEIFIQKLAVGAEI